MSESATRYRASRPSRPSQPSRASQPSGSTPPHARRPRPSTDPHGDQSRPAATPGSVPTLPSHLAAAEGDRWLARALALADGYPPLPACAARWLTPHEYDEALREVEIFALPSRSQPGRIHLVRYDGQLMTLRCLGLEEALETLAAVGHDGAVELDTRDLVGCIAGGIGRPCRHAGAVWKWVAAHDEWLARNPAQRARDEYRAATDAATWDEVEAGAVGITLLPIDN